MKWLILAVLALIWGSSFILIKHAVHDDSGQILLTPWQVGSGRIVLAGLFLMPFTFGKWHLLRKPKVLIALLVSGMIGNLIPSFLFATAETGISSSLAGILNATTPLFTVVISLIFLHQKLLPRQWGGVVLGFLSVVALVKGDVTGDVGHALLIPIATLCYATSMITIKTYLGDLKPLEITSLSFMMAMIPAGVVLLTTDIQGASHHPEFSTNFTYLAILAIVGTALAIVLFNRLIQMTDPIFTSMVTYLIPLVAICWGILDGETFSWLHLSGMLGILCGVLLVNLRKRA